MNPAEPLPPADQAASPLNGVIPPVESRWKPGQSGNPSGRPRSAGASVREFVNDMQEMTAAEILAIARDATAPVNKRAAAERWLRAIEVCDIATFQPVLDGKKTLAELSSEGVNTEVVKRLKFGEHGPEIELHDRSGEDFDRISDRTDGKPRQSVDVSSGLMPQAVEIIFPMMRSRDAEPSQG